MTVLWLALAYIKLKVRRFIDDFDRAVSEAGGSDGD